MCFHVLTIWSIFLSWRNKPISVKTTLVFRMKPFLWPSDCTRHLNKLRPPWKYSKSCKSRFFVSFTNSIAGGRPGHPKKERRVGQLAGLLIKKIIHRFKILTYWIRCKGDFAGQHWSEKGCTLGNPSRSCVSAGGKCDCLGWEIWLSGMSNIIVWDEKHKLSSKSIRQ